MIRFNCPECNARIEVDETYAGRPGRCPSCGTAITVPSALKTPPRTAPLSQQAVGLQRTTIRVHGELISIRPPMEGAAIAGLALACTAVVLFFAIWAVGIWFPPEGVGALLGLLTAILAVIVSATGYYSIVRSKGMNRGKPLAVAGMAGGAGLFIVFLIIAAWSFAAYASRPPCEDNLKAIWDALNKYADTHEDQFPPTLAVLVQEAGLDRSRLTCPAYHVRSGQQTYQYIAGLNRKDFPPDTAIVYDGKPWAHEDGRVRVLLIDGNVIKVQTEAWEVYFRMQRQIVQDVFRELVEEKRPEEKGGGGEAP